MDQGEIITAIDIGSSRIKTVIGSFDSEGKLRVLGLGTIVSNGIRKGTILDMERFKKDVDTSLADAERMTGETVSNIILSLSGSTLEVFTNNGIVAVPTGEVTEEDISRALDMSQNGMDLINRVVLKVIPETFKLDHESGVKNPLGMAAKKLEVRSHIFTIAENSLNNIKKAIYDVGVEIVDIFPNALSSAEAVLSRRQKELGSVCVEIGSTNSGICVYEEGSLIYSSIIPIGGEHVTSDIALGLRVSTELAEKLKIEYADVLLCSDEKSKDEEIDLAKLSKNESVKISRKYLSEIVRARYVELFYFVNQELKQLGKDGMLPEGAILTGGGAKVRGLSDLAKDQLRLPVIIGIPDDNELLTGTSLGDPAYSALLGSLLLSKKYGSARGSFRVKFAIGGLFASFKNLFSKIIPR